MRQTKHADRNWARTLAQKAFRKREFKPACLRKIYIAWEAKRMRFVVACLQAGRTLIGGKWGVANVGTLHQWGPGYSAPCIMRQTVKRLIQAGLIVRDGRWLCLNKNGVQAGQALSLCRVESKAKLRNAA